MGLYLLRRLLHLGPVLLGVSVIVFIVLHLTPGDPAEVMLGSLATKEDLTRLRTELGLDRPLHVQYFTWIGHVLRGDLGRSLWMKRPVLAEVLERYKATLLLTASALLLSTVGGIALGIASAARANSLLDRLSAVASLFGASMPVFWLGIVLDGDLLALARLAPRLRHVRAVRRRRAPRTSSRIWCSPPSRSPPRP